ncbi:type II toxin-antitoxin system RelE/ParE family toxin [Dyadobacter sp. 3J3]|uniref:type II toxin-antitoxin system RelE/ParE family toxin n=1 Tax=Dyadobacter sp. 3J3 TaxID=2606600 RepID=UPI001359BD17
MTNYKLTNLAVYDLEKIWEYTVEEWSLSQAEKYINGLLISFDLIGTGRIKGKSIDQVREGYKKALYRKHYIFFRLSSNQVVEIIRILHITMDVNTHL